VPAPGCVTFGDAVDDRLGLVVALGERGDGEPRAVATRPSLVVLRSCDSFLRRLSRSTRHERCDALERELFWGRDVMGRAPSFLVVGMLVFSRVVSTFEGRPDALGNGRVALRTALAAVAPSPSRVGKHRVKSAMPASLFANSVVVFVRRLSVWVEHP
jgi:hypothetical protein